MINQTTDCLLIVDVQNDFCQGGALAVPDGDQVVPVINNVSKLFKHKILTQDWHPEHHGSFASSHPGESPFVVIEVGYGDQVLWPDHCVQGTHGAEFHPDLRIKDAELIVRKGFRTQVDSYSAFFENDRETPTGLTGYLRDRGFEKIYMAGLATDFCVAYSAIDARNQDFEVVLIEDACRAIDMDGSLDNALEQMESAGVVKVTSTEIEAA